MRDNSIANGASCVVGGALEIRALYIGIGDEFIRKGRHSHYYVYIYQWHWYNSCGAILTARGGHGDVSVLSTACRYVSPLVSLMDVAVHEMLWRWHGELIGNFISSNSNSHFLFLFLHLDVLRLRLPPSTLTALEAGKDGGQR